MRSARVPWLRRPLRWSGTAGVVIGAFLLATGGVAVAKDASSIDDLGWWTRTNQTGLLGDALAPDVSEGQLLVEGTPEGATAIAAIRATLPPDSRQPVLTLDVASSSGGETAILLACQAGSGWTGVHAGQWSAKPNPDCEQSAQGVPDGETITFELRELQFGDQLNFVLVPGVDPSSGAGSTFRFVFDEPTAASIQVSESSVEPDFEVPDFDSGDFGSTGAAPGADTAGGSAVGGDAGSSFTPPSSSSFSSPSPTMSSGDELASPPAQAALPADEQGQTATAPILSASNPLPPAPLPASDSSTSDGRLLGLLVVLCAGGVLYWSSQLETPPHRVLSRFASAAEGGAVDVTAAPEPEEKRMGGVGRFRRVRDTPARRLGG